jgi:hypothetical protein
MRESKSLVLPLHYGVTPKPLIYKVKPRSATAFGQKPRGPIGAFYSSPFRPQPACHGERHLLQFAGQIDAHLTDPFRQSQ